MDKLLRYLPMGLVLAILALLIYLVSFKMWIELIVIVSLGFVQWGWTRVKPDLVMARRKEVRDSFSDAYDIAMILVLFMIFGFYVVARAQASGSGGIAAVFPALLWSLACLVSGAGMGFLFGVPKVVQEEVAGRKKDEGTSDAKSGQSSNFGYKQRVNSNLEEISDWLTKIIVGLGLVELGKLFKYFKKAADCIGAGVGQGDFAGRSFGAAVIIFFGGIGFLSSYLLTRLFLAGAFFRAERDANAFTSTEEDLAAVKQAAPSSLDAATQDLRKAGGSPEAAVRDRATGASTEAAQRIVTKNFSELETAKSFAAWAEAKLSLGEFKDAVRGYAEAVRRAPEDAESRLNYAVALFYENPQRPIRDIQEQLWAAYKLISSGMNKDLVRRIYTDLMFNLLYDTTHEGYEHAVKLGEEYVANPDYPHSSEIWLYLACAYGQKYKAHQGISPETLASIKQRAAHCVRESLNLDPGKRVLIESLLRPPKPDWMERLITLFNKRVEQDDDLQVFDDTNFRSAAGL